MGLPAIGLLADAPALAEDPVAVAVLEAGVERLLARGIVETAHLDAAAVADRVVAVPRIQHPPSIGQVVLHDALDAVVRVVGDDGAQVQRATAGVGGLGFFQGPIAVGVVVVAGPVDRARRGLLGHFQQQAIGSVLVVARALAADRGRRGGWVVVLPVGAAGALGGGGLCGLALPIVDRLRQQLPARCVVDVVVVVTTQIVVVDQPIEVVVIPRLLVEPHLLAVAVGDRRRTAAAAGKAVIGQGVGLADLVAVDIVRIGHGHALGGPCPQQAPLAVVVVGNGLALGVGHREPVAVLVQGVAFQRRPGVAGTASGGVAERDDLPGTVVVAPGDASHRILRQDLPPQCIVGELDDAAGAIDLPLEQAVLVLIAAQIAIGIASGDEAAGGVVVPGCLRPPHGLFAAGADDLNPRAGLEDDLIELVVIVVGRCAACIRAGHNIARTIVTLAGADGGTCVKSRPILANHAPKIVEGIDSGDHDGCTAGSGRDRMLLADLPTGRIVRVGPHHTIAGIGAQQAPIGIVRVVLGVVSGLVRRTDRRALVCDLAKRVVQDLLAGVDLNAGGHASNEILPCRLRGQLAAHRIVGEGRGDVGPATVVAVQAIGFRQDAVRGIERACLHCTGGGAFPDVTPLPVVAEALHGIGAGLLRCRIARAQPKRICARLHHIAESVVPHPRIRRSGLIQCDVIEISEIAGRQR
ncbi:hypothetical protein NB717_003656 [Xanthomonas sacchari]|nr:hypothetical protein [Xanthomonas sacchari]